jgi:hypothetical protein
MHQQGRGHLQQVAGGVRLGHQHTGDAHLAGAQLDGVAHRHAQRLEQARVGIGLAAAGSGCGFRVQAGAVARHLQLAAQRVVPVHAAHGGHLAGLAVEQHAGEGHGARAAQAAPRRLGGEFRRGFHPALHAQVAADDLGGTAFQRQVDPVHQGADRGHRRHAQHQRGGHGQQVAAGQLAAQRADGVA